MSELAIVLLVLIVLAAVPLATAERASEALVRARARRLPINLAQRFEEEWTGELSSINCRIAKLAFAVALVFTSRRAFASENSTIVNETRHFAEVSMLAGWKSMLIIPTVLFAVGAYGASFLLPVQFASEAVLDIIPLSDIVHRKSEEPVEDRVETLRGQLLNRGALVQIVLGFNGRQSIDTTVREIQKNTTIRFTPVGESATSGGKLVVRYVDSNPKAAQRVTAGLISKFLDTERRVREARLVAREDFLQAQLVTVAARLKEMDSRLGRERTAQATGAGSVLTLDRELLKSTYSALFAEHEEFQMVSWLEQRRNRFVITESPEVGQPVGPDRTLITIIGALSGFSLGAGAVGGLSRKRQRLPA